MVAMSRRRAALVIALGLCASMTSCGLVLPFDRFDTSSPGTPLYAVGGRVDGLTADETVEVTLNGAASMTLGNGAFAFPAALASGAGYAIAVASGPKDRTYTVANSAGTLVAADVTGIGVHCASNDTTLSSLTVSVGVLSPRFSPTTLTYEAAVSAIFPPGSTTVTATATDPGAHVSINGVATKSGSASAAIPIKSRTIAIRVLVTAADGAHTQLYTLTTADPFGEIASVTASNAASAEQFGELGVAVALDGETLAVGAPSELSTATGVSGGDGGGDGGVVSSAGAAYVFVRNGRSWKQQAYVKGRRPGRC